MVGIGKVVVMLLLIVGVWYGFKLLARVMGQTGEQGAVARERFSPRDRAAAEAHSSAVTVEDLRPCPRCGAYVLDGQGTCSQTGCPLGVSRAPT